MKGIVDIEQKEKGMIGFCFEWDKGKIKTIFASERKRKKKDSFLFRMSRHLSARQCCQKWSLFHVSC
jgi:hypothetical protein